MGTGFRFRRVNRLHLLSIFRWEESKKKASHLCKAFCTQGGSETSELNPQRHSWHNILNPACLPIPPRERIRIDIQQKKASHFCKAFVLKAGLEPARPNGHRILSPACLPIPPLEHTRTGKERKTAPTLRRNPRTFYKEFFEIRFRLERKTGFEPATSTLARWRSTN